MSTRSNVVIMENGKQLIRIYRQCDGYPTGMGNDLKDILNNGQVKIVNGYSMGQKCPAFFNGMGCLAAYVISKMKVGIGDVYIDGRKKLGKNDFDIEYVYTISKSKTDETLNIEVLSRYLDNGKVLYSGPLSKFDAEKCEKSEVK